MYLKMSICMNIVASKPLDVTLWPAKQARAQPAEVDDVVAACRRPTHMLGAHDACRLPRGRLMPVLGPVDTVDTVAQGPAARPRARRSRSAARSCAAYYGAGAAVAAPRWHHSPWSKSPA